METDRAEGVKHGGPVSRLTSLQLDEITEGGRFRWWRLWSGGAFAQKALP